MHYQSGNDMYSDSNNLGAYLAGLLEGDGYIEMGSNSNEKKRPNRACGLGLALACFVPYYIRFIPYIIRYKTRYHTPSAFGVMSESELVVFVAFFVPFLFLCFFRVFYVLFILYYI